MRGQLLVIRHPPPAPPASAARACAPPAARACSKREIAGAFGEEHQAAEFGARARQRRRRRRRELIPQILTWIVMGLGLWAPPIPKIKQTRNRGVNPRKCQGFGRSRGPPWRGPARAVMGRPITRMLAPASCASAGPITRCWSPTAAPAGRMPGTTSRKSGPSVAAQRRDLMRRADHAVQPAIAASACASRST